MILRPYQATTLEQLRAKIRAGHRRLVLVAPTGAGKTVMAAEMIRAAVERGSRVVVAAHRKELIDQTVEKLARFGVQAGVVMANDRRRDDWLPVQVCSIQTLTRRMKAKVENLAVNARPDRFALPPADLFVYDEVHHAAATTCRDLLEAYSRSVIIGLTATPWRSDKLGLDDLFEDSVLSATPAELMRIGALVEYDAFAYDAPDLHEVGIVAGDFNQKDLGIACNTQVLVGSVVREYLAHAQGRRAIVFPVNIVHSKALVGEFLSAGVNAEHVDCHTPRDVRASAMERFRSGNLMVLSSVGVLTEGFDAPAAEVCVLARPTKSMTLHLQMIGRVLRPSPETGKARALVHDHAGNLLRHGFVEDDRDYSLSATPKRVRDLHECPFCHAVYGAAKPDGTCPKCGELIQEPKEEPKAPGPREEKDVVEGQRIDRAQIEAMRAHREKQGLPAFGDRKLARVLAATTQDMGAEYLRLVGYAQEHGFKPAWAGYEFHKTFGVWPMFRRGELDGIAAAEQAFFSRPKDESLTDGCGVAGNPQPAT